MTTPRKTLIDMDLSLCRILNLADPTSTQGAATKGYVDTKYGGVVAAGSISSSYTADASLANQFNLTLTGNVTLVNPSNPTEGQGITYRLLQDGTGGRTVTLDTKFRDPAGVAAGLLKVASKAEYLSAVYYAADDKWDVMPGLGVAY